MSPEEIKDARHALGFSVSEFAEAIGLNDPLGNGADTVRKWERGKREITGPAARCVELLLMRANDRLYGYDPAYDEGPLAGWTIRDLIASVIDEGGDEIDDDENSV